MCFQEYNNQGDNQSVTKVVEGRQKVNIFTIEYPCACIKVMPTALARKVRRVRRKTRAVARGGQGPWPPFWGKGQTK